MDRSYQVKRHLCSLSLTAICSLVLQTSITYPSSLLKHECKAAWPVRVPWKVAQTSGQLTWFSSCDAHFAIIASLPISRTFSALILLNIHNLLILLITVLYRINQLITSNVHLKNQGQRLYGVYTLTFNSVLFPAKSTTDDYTRNVKSWLHYIFPAPYSKPKSGWTITALKTCAAAIWPKHS